MAKVYKWAWSHFHTNLWPCKYIFKINTYRWCFTCVFIYMMTYLHYHNEIPRVQAYHGIWCLKDTTDMVISIFQLVNHKIVFTLLPLIFLIAKSFFHTFIVHFLNHSIFFNFLTHNDSVRLCQCFSQACPSFLTIISDYSLVFIGVQHFRFENWTRWQT